MKVEDCFLTNLLCEQSIDLYKSHTLYSDKEYKAADFGYIRMREIIRLKLVTVLLPEAYLEGLDELVRANMYQSRSSVIRSAVRDLLKKELWENKRGR